MFFARALIVVEGDGEHLLLPAIAEKLGRPLRPIWRCRSLTWCTVACSGTADSAAHNRARGPGACGAYP